MMMMMMVACVLFLQVLALVFIRKLLDCIFTKREMSWLDDLMPESKKKKLEDAEEVTSLTVETSLPHIDVSSHLLCLTLQEEGQSMTGEDEDGGVQVPLEGFK